MNIHKLAAVAIVAGAAVVFGSGSAWSAQEKDSNPDGAVSQDATAPKAGTVLSAPATGPQGATSAQAETQTMQPVRRAGLAKPIRVYWFLSGR